jgi:hypothetical protein
MQLIFLLLMQKQERINSSSTISSSRTRIISTHLKEGKRGMRVYPPWDLPSSKQAKKTQQWQLPYF